MDRVLTWRFFIPVGGALAVLPHVLPAPKLGVVLVLMSALAAGTAYWSVLTRPLRTKLGIGLSGTGAFFQALMLVDWTAGDGAVGPIGVVLNIVAALFYASGGLPLLASRRPKFYREGLLDAFAAIIAVGAFQIQMAPEPGHRELTGVGAVVPNIAVAVLLAGVAAIMVRLIFDKNQNQAIIRAFILACLLGTAAAVMTSTYSDPEASRWAYSLFIVGILFTWGAYGHSGLVGPSVPEPDGERHGNVLRWLGPASALVVGPAIVGLLALRHEAPGFPVALATILLTVVVLMRINKLMKSAERSRARAELSRARVAASEERLRALVQNSSDVVAVIDASGVITYVSGGIEELVGRTTDEVVGTNLKLLFAPESQACLMATMRQAIEQLDGVTRSSDLLLDRGCDSERWASMRITNHQTTTDIGGWVVNIHDTTDRKLAESVLSQMALYDSLTGLPNRANMLQQLDASMSNSAGTTALLFCDLDGFKAVNDSLGHESGDEVLRAVAARWSALLRPQDVLGRWGGDEFLIVCPDIVSVDDASRIAERLVGSLDGAISLSTGEATLGASIGLVIHRRGEGLDQLIGRADSAMYEAKRSQGGVQVA